MQRFVHRWKAIKSGPSITQAFVPLSFSPGEVCQFDWSHEHVELGGVMQTVKVAHFRLAFSRQMFVAAYPRETQEMVFDAHNQAPPAPNLTWRSRHGYPYLYHSRERHELARPDGDLLTACAESATSTRRWAPSPTRTNKS